MQKILIVLALSFVTSWAKAQESTADLSTSVPIRNTKLKVIPTLGYADFTGEASSAAGISTTSGFMGGVLVDTDFYKSNQWLFQTGLLYLQEGDSVPSAGFQRSNNYISIPLTTKFNFLTTNLTTMSILGGLNPCLLLNSQTSHSGNARDATGRTEWYDLQVQAGLSSEFKVSSSLTLAASVSAVRGLVNFLPNRSSVIYNQGYIFDAGIVF